MVNNLKNNNMKQMKKLVKDNSLRKRFGIAAKERIISHFNYRNSVEEFGALFRRLI